MKNKKSLDLFGQIIVTQSDLALWIDTHAPTISPRRRAFYSRFWNVPDKVRQAIAAGQWPPPTKP